MFVKSAFNFDRDKNSLDTGIAIDPEEDMAKQEFQDETDINTILKRFNVTGHLPENVRAPVYADFSEVYDFHSAANAIAEAHEAFDAMPAEVRKRFKNDPAEFVAFCSDERNRDEATRLGLVVPPPEVLNPPPKEPPKEPVVGEG